MPGDNQSRKIPEMAVNGAGADPYDGIDSRAL